MRLTRLSLSNMRNYATLDFSPQAGLNVFIGNNAQGKSNLLEAISLLGTGKSFRTSAESDLIREGFELASISGDAELRAGTIHLSCGISAGL
ncbi:MAG: AAA family ATPase, partial [Candidatus Eremiobacteraeota bacterium]|nr:AAA family ATPase [Candidatus Eremiobacteraeota bacterium]